MRLLNGVQLPSLAAVAVLFLYAASLVVPWIFSGSGSPSTRSPATPRGGRPFSLNPACPNALLVTSDNAGLGHRISAIAVAIAISKGSKGALILDDSLWNTPRGVKGESMTFLKTLLRLEAFFSAKEMKIAHDFKRGFDGKFTVPVVETPQGTLRTVGPLPNQSCEDSIEMVKSGCNQVVLLPTGQPFTCREGTERVWCLEDVPGAYDTSRAILSNLYASSPLRRRHILGKRRDGSLVVAWHLRNDDIKLHNGTNSAAYFANVHSALERASKAAGIPLAHYMVCEQAFSKSDKDYGHLYSIPGFTFQQLVRRSIADSFLFLVEADVLVTTGSSFANSAALLAPAGQVVLFSMPKESKTIGDRAYRTYRLAHAVGLRKDGSVSEGDIGMLTTKIMKRAADK